jgi:hypothetical protein
LGRGSSDIDTIVAEKIVKNSVDIMSYPPDIPKYNFTIIQNEWHNFGAPMVAERMFKLPMPRELMDKTEINYDTNFNYLSTIMGMFKGAAGLANMGSAVDAAADAAKIIPAALGITINNYKSVTLQVPDFKTHQLSWVFSPKTFQEALTIQKMITALKKGMSPRWGPGGLHASMYFPKMYTMYFSPNPHWLFKFKTCVLSSLVVDYTGGAGMPAFMAGSQGSLPDRPTENPPQSVMIATNWIETEYWMSEEYQVDQTGMPTRDPLDGNSWYNYGSNTSPNVTGGDLGSPTAGLPNN